MTDNNIANENDTINDIHSELIFDKKDIQIISNNIGSSNLGNNLIHIQTNTNINESNDDSYTSEYESSMDNDIKEQNNDINDDISNDVEYYDESDMNSDGIITNFDLAIDIIDDILAYLFGMKPLNRE